MRITTLALAFLVVLGLVQARRAEACGGGAPISDGAIGAIVVVGGAYVGGTIAFGVKDLASDDHSLGYGVGEVAFNLPFTLLWGGAMIEDFSNDSPYNNHEMGKTAAVFTAIHGGLLAHGVYTIVKRSRNRGEKKSGPMQQQHYGPPGAVQVGGVTAVVTPAPMANGAGLGLSGTF